MELNPSHIVSMTDCSPATLQNIIAHLEVSTDFEHLVYREAELDAIWSITGFFLRGAPASAERSYLELLHDSAHQAHDLVADRRPRDAAALLRRLL
jgi:hypothetical protein